ncbi:MFS transporter [Bacillus pinisoli]|uniref:MFS transporter n=1 Tax=Bacillus pinisoli TaxID=2901866 RepID=UPI003AEF9CAB
MQLVKKNLVIMWIANFFVAASATMVLPFLSLYIETFGTFTDDYVQKWSGFVFSITFLSALFFSPIWGRVSDKHGYKRILMITGFGISVSVFFMGFVNSVEQLFLLRLIMGIVTGFIPTSIAFISSQASKESAGKTLATLQTGTVSGSLLGPLLGGLIVDLVGFQYTFILTSFFIFAAAVLVTFGVKEIKKDEASTKKVYSRKEVFFQVLQSPLLFMTMIVSLIIQVANFSIQPVLALYVNDLSNGANIALLAGLAFSITGLGNLVATRKWGQLGDRIGYEKVLLLLLLMAAIFFIPQSFVTQLWQLIILRFFFGIALGGMIPCMTAYVRELAPSSVQGEVLGYNVSFRFLGNVIGPSLGGILSGVFGIASVFIMSGSLFLVAALVLWLMLRRETTAEQQSFSA